MATQALTGKDTVKINDRILADFADGDVTTVAYPNDKVTVKTGKNGNTIFAQNAGGANADVEIKILRGSPDDKFLSSLKATQDRDFAGFTLISGQFIKRIGDGAGGISNTIFNLTGGVFKKENDGKDNVEGDTDQATSLYRLIFALVPQTIS